MREERRRGGRNTRKMGERGKRGKKVSGMTRIDPEVEFVERRWTGGTFEDVVDGMTRSGAFGAEIVVGTFDEVFPRP